MSSLAFKAIAASARRIVLVGVLTFAFAWLIAIVVRLLDEETLLRQNLSGYDDYCQKVRFGLIPYVW